MSETSDWYGRLMDEDARNAGIDPFEAREAPGLVPFLRSGGSLSDWCAAKRGDRDNNAASQSLAAFMDCLIERRAVSVPRIPPQALADAVWSAAAWPVSKDIP